MQDGVCREHGAARQETGPREPGLGGELRRLEAVARAPGNVDMAEVR